MDLRQQGRDLLRASKHLGELRREALRVYRPLPGQLPFFVSEARRLVGRGGNRAGKTLNGAARLASIVTGENEHWRKKRPEGGKALVVSLDFSLLSKNCYSKLFEPGSFRVCRECRRTRLGCDCGDGFMTRSMPAGPLIPDRLVRRIVWLDKARKIPDRAYLRTGWVIDFRSCESGRQKFQGDAWDLAWIDEEGGSDEDVMNEIERGLLETEGWLWWTATPLAAGVKLLEYSEKAQEEEAERLARPEDVSGPPHYQEVVLLTDDNIMLDKGALDRFYEGMSEEEERVRRQGDFLIQQGRVYPEWDKDLHVVDTYGIPEDWTVYDFLDPGHANAFAILMIAVKPDGDWVAFDEIYVARTDIPTVVKEWHKRLSGSSRALDGRPHWSQRTAIDPASNQIHAGMKKNSVRQQIHKERRRRKFRSFQGEFKMFNAPNAKMAGILAVKAMLNPRTGLPAKDPRHGTPKLTVMGHLYHFQREIRRYRYPRPTDGKSINERTGPVQKDDHLMDLIRYAALMGCEPVPARLRPPWARGAADPFQRLERRKKRRRKRQRKQAMDCT